MKVVIATPPPTPRAACDHGAPAALQLRSTHRTSAGAVAYARCPCGAWLVLLDGRLLAAAHPAPRAATPPVPGERPRGRGRRQSWLWLWLAGHSARSARARLAAAETRCASASGGRPGAAGNTGSAARTGVASGAGRPAASAAYAAAAATG